MYVLCEMVTVQHFLPYYREVWTVWFIDSCCIATAGSVSLQSPLFPPTHIQYVREKGGALSVLTSAHVVWATAVTL